MVLDKAAGIGSNAALQAVKRLYEAEKAGHTGSLDPLATGVLPLCLGEATKVSGFLLDSDKRYRARVRLGVRTSTGDADGEEIARGEPPALSRREAERALERFRGEIEQVPPMHSAVKRGGVPLYRLARRGEVVERAPRRVTVRSLTLTALGRDGLELDIACSKGTYVRAIADELGQALGCGAHVAALRRTGAGPFTERDCVGAGELEAEKAAGGLEAIDRRLLPMDRALEGLPAVRLTGLAAERIRRGQPVLVRHLPAEGLVRLYEGERFVGVGGIDDDGRVAPKRLVLGRGRPGPD